MSSHGFDGDEAGSWDQFRDAFIQGILGLSYLEVRKDFRLAELLEQTIGEGHLRLSSLRALGMLT